MFKIGDLIIYSGHGICRVDDICEKTYNGETKQYYVLHPVENSQQLTISTPVDNGKSVMVKLINHEEAEDIINSFKTDGAEWIDKPQLRAKVYNDIVKTGNRLKIAQVANTLLQKKAEVEKDGKKFYELDSKILTSIQNILFKELAMALETSYEDVTDRVNQLIS